MRKNHSAALVGNTGVGVNRMRQGSFFNSSITALAYIAVSGYTTVVLIDMPAEKHLFNEISVVADRSWSGYAGLGKARL